MLKLNKIYNMDCLVGMDRLDDKSIDMIFVDLPYGITANNLWDTVIPFKELWSRFNRIIKDNGAVLLFGQGAFTAKLILSNESMYKYSIIWNKVLLSGFLNAKKQPLRVHEDIAVFYKNQCTYNPQMTYGDQCHSKGNAVGTKCSDSMVNNNYGEYNVVETEGNMKYPTTIWEFSKPHPSIALHPTQKPVDLCRYAIRTFTNENDIVLDCCCGAGTIPLAAALEGRRYIGMDNGNHADGMSWANISTKRIATAMIGDKDLSKSELKHRASAEGQQKKLF